MISPDLHARREDYREVLEAVVEQTGTRDVVNLRLGELNYGQVYVEGNLICWKLMDERPTFAYWVHDSSDPGAPTLVMCDPHEW